MIRQFYMLLTLLLGVFSLQAQEPSLEWVKFIEGSGTVNVNDIAVDNEGNVYSVGSFNGFNDFDPGPSSTAFDGEGQAFILKQDVNGEFVWVKVLENVSLSASSKAENVMIDNEGKLVISGTFKGTVDFDPNLDVFELESISTLGSTFLLKLNDSEDFEWCISHSGYSNVSGLTEDNLGNYILYGGFSFVVDFDGNNGQFNIDASTNFQGYIAKYSESSNLIWVKAFEGESSFPRGIDIDSDNNLLIVGSFSGMVDFDGGNDEFILNSSLTGGSGSIPSRDIFYLKYNQNGIFLNAMSWGNIGEDYGHAIVIDSESSFYVAGSFVNSVDFDFGVNEYILNTLSDHSDGFVCKYNSSLEFQWAINLSGFGPTSFRDIILNSFENEIVIIGDSQFGPSTHFIEPSNIEALELDGPSDGFFMQFNSNGDYQFGVPLTRSSATSYQKIEYSNGAYFMPFAYQGTMDFAPGDSVLQNSTEIGNTDGVILKLTNEYISSLSEGQDAKSEALIYPNPSNGQFNVLLPSLKSSVQVNVYDHLTRLVSSQQERTNSFQVEIAGASGLYFIEFLGEDGFLERQKVLKH